jgi:hypothetical protein
MKIRKTLLLILTAIALLSFPKVNFGQTAPTLGAASSYALFTGTGASFANNGASTLVTGDIGSNASPITGFSSGQVVGQTHAQDATSGSVATAVTFAYGNFPACGTTLPSSTLGNGQILSPGVYCRGEASTLDGILTLDALYDPNAVFIIEIGGAFTVGATLASNINLINSASLCNVYWRVVGAFSLASGSAFGGTVIASGAISLLEGSSLLGRGLSIAGAIDLHNNIVTLFPAAAGIITGTDNVCQGQTGVGYSVSAITNATGYIWSLPAGASIAAGANTNSITVDFSAIAVSGNITVQGSNGAGTGTVSPNYAVTVNPLPATSLIYHNN